MKSLKWILVALFLIGCMVGTIPTSATPPQQAVVWTQHVATGNCADNSGYSFWEHEGTTDNLLIFFQGGGLCWDAFTCQYHASDGFNGYYNSAVIDQDNPNLSAVTIYDTGLMDLNHASNPFGDWNVVQIPMCTGDLGIGGRDVIYGNTRSLAEFAWFMNYNGAQNINSVLDWVFATYPDPDNVGIVGCSAGGPASLFHTPRIMDTYASADNIFQVSDSLAMERLRDTVLEVWGGLDYRSTAIDWSIKQQTIDTAAAYPTRYFASVNSAADATQALYEGVAPSELITLLDIQTKTIANNASNYRYWTHAEGYHCISLQSSYYAWAQGGVYLYEWMAALANGTPLASQHYQN